MQKSVLLGAGAVVLIVAAVIVVRKAGNHEAARVVDQNIDQIIATLPPGYSASHGATDVNPITGTLTIRNLVVNRDGKRLWSAEEATISGADQAALHDVFDPTAYPNGHPAWTARRLLINDATASGVHIPTEGPNPAEVVIKTITLHQLSGRPFILPPTSDTLNNPVFRADAALDFAVETADLHDLSLTGTAPRAQKLTLGSASLHDYDGGKIGAAALHDLAIDAAGGKHGAAALHATLDSVEIKQLDTSATLENLRNHAPPDRSAISSLNYQSFHLTGMDIEVNPGPRFALSDAHAVQLAPDANGVRIGNATITGLVLALKDTVVPPAQQAALAAFGLNAITMDITAKGHTTLTPPQTDVTEDVVFHDLGTLHLAAGLSGYDRNATGANAMAALMATSIDHATIEWDDSGLVNRSLAAAAAQMHSTPDVLRAQLAIPLVTLGLMVPDQPDLADQVTAFVNHPNILIVTIAPPQKITIGQVSQAEVTTRAHLLGLHVQAK